MKYQIGHVSCDTCFLVNFGKGIQLHCPLACAKQVYAGYSEGHVKVRPKRLTFQFHRCQQKSYLTDAT